MLSRFKLELDIKHHVTETEF